MRRQIPRPEFANARQQGLHNIGEAGTRAGVSAKMIRHYEGIGLIPTVGRTLAACRLYREADLHRLRFIKRARSLGFSIRHVEALLSLWSDPKRASRALKRQVQAHAEALEQKTLEMQYMQRALRDPARPCYGEERPDCPVFDDLGGCSREREVMRRSSSRASRSAASSSRRQTRLIGSARSCSCSTRALWRSISSSNG